jgi:hypothetical protein
MNPYLITGPAQIGISGGRTSAHMVYKTLEAHGGALPPDVHLFFQNTGKERGDAGFHRPDRQALESEHRLDGVMPRVRSAGRCALVPAGGFRNIQSQRRTVHDNARVLRRVQEGREKPGAGATELLEQYVHRVPEGEDRRKHMRALGYTEWDCVVGIRYDEPKRYHRMMAANDRGGTRGDNLCPSYTAGITKEDVAEFWSAQRFDLGMDSDFGNCDL